MDKLPGRKIRLDTVRQGMFHDELSGIKLDIFGNGSVTTIPANLSDDKLVNIENAINAHILMFDENAPPELKQLDSDRNRILSILQIPAAQACILITKITNTKDLELLLAEEEAGRKRKRITDYLKARILKLSTNIVAKKEKEFQINNIIEHA